jgi:hypothetical protein
MRVTKCDENSVKVLYTAGVDPEGLVTSAVGFAPVGCARRKHSCVA